MGVMFTAESHTVPCIIHSFLFAFGPWLCWDFGDSSLVSIFGQIVRHIGCAWEGFRQVRQIGSNARQKFSIGFSSGLMPVRGLRAASGVIKSDKACF